MRRKVIASLIYRTNAGRSANDLEARSRKQEKVTTAVSARKNSALSATVSETDQWKVKRNPLWDFFLLGAQ